MTLKKFIYFLKTGRITKANIKGFLQGNFRKYRAEGLPDHIKEQIMWRLVVMNPACLEKGECPCECKVPEKQYEDRECEEGCYPILMEEHIWNTFKERLGVDMYDIRNELRKRIKDYDLKLEFRI